MLEVSSQVRRQRLLTCLFLTARLPNPGLEAHQRPYLPSFYALGLTLSLSDCMPALLTSWTMELLCSWEKKEPYLKGQVPGVSFLVSNDCVVNGSGFVFLSLLSIFFSLYCQAARHWPWAHISTGHLVVLQTWVPLSFTLSQPSIWLYFCFLISAKEQGQISFSKNWTAVPKFPFYHRNPNCFLSLTDWFGWGEGDYKNKEGGQWYGFYLWVTKLNTATGLLH